MDRREGRAKGRANQVMVRSPLTGELVPRMRKGNGPAGERDHVARRRMKIQALANIAIRRRRKLYEVKPVKK